MRGELGTIDEVCACVCVWGGGGFEFLDFGLFTLPLPSPLPSPFSWPPLPICPDLGPRCSVVRPLAFDGKLALNRVGIDTGRTHQIRVHLAHLR